MMKTIKTFAIAALFAFAAAPLMAAPSAKVYINSLVVKPHVAVVSVVGSNSIKNMEVTSENGSVSYLSKRLSDVNSAQYLLDIASLKDGVYNVNFEFANGDVISKLFVVRDGKVVK